MNLPITRSPLLPFLCRSVFRGRLFKLASGLPLLLHLSLAHFLFPFFSSLTICSMGASCLSRSVSVLARLALDHRAQGIKLGASLLQDVVSRAVVVSQSAGVRALLVASRVLQQAKACTSPLIGEQGRLRVKK